MLAKLEKQKQSSNLLFYIIGKTVLAEAYDALDPEGNITMKWDVMSWTPDGYVVSFNNQKKNT